jgi:hypothetical protein
VCAVIERHQDYQLTLQSVPPGGIRQVPLQLDTDAPFALRLVKSRNLGVSGFNFETPRKAYQASGLRTDVTPPTLTNPLALPTPGVIVYPQLVYPQGGEILVDVGNSTGQPLTNVRILFRGAKLYPDGALRALSYPPKFSTLPFTYTPDPAVIAQVPVSGSAQPAPGWASNYAAVLNNQLRTLHDSYFVFRYGVCDPFFPGVDGGPVNGAPRPVPQPLLSSFQEVYVWLRDESRNTYSNEPIHVDDLFGRGAPLPVNTNNDRVLWRPGLITPEIYLEPEAALYFDVFRSDSNQFSPVDLYFRFQGAKVFPQ